MPGEVVGELGLVGRLERVVELLAHAVAQLVDQALGVETLQDERGAQSVQRLGVVEVGLDRVADARVLHLHGHLAPVARDGAVHLADAGRGDRLRPASRGRPARAAAPSSSVTTRPASSGAIGGASACSVASACWASSGSASMMKLSSWPNFISAPFICPARGRRPPPCGWRTARRARRRVALVVAPRDQRPTDAASVSAAVAHAVARRAAAERSRVPDRGRRDGAPRRDERRLGRRHRAQVSDVGVRRATRARRRRRVGSEQLVGQRLAGDLVGPVGAGVEPGQRDLDVGEIGSIAARSSSAACGAASAGSGSSMTAA